MANGQNNFKFLSDAEIHSAIHEISENAISPYILPINVMFDLSGSMQPIVDKALRILEYIKIEFSKIDCPCYAYLILSVIYNCRQTSDTPQILYSGFVYDFDFDDFKLRVKDCYGLTPLVNALKQVSHYGSLLLDHLDSVARTHSCPVNIFVTDYIENVANDAECHAAIETIQRDIENEQQLAIEFVLTESQALNSNVDLSKAVSFGGFRCRYDEQEIKKLIEALKLSTSTIFEVGEPQIPSTNVPAYNDRLRRNLIRKMVEYWDHT